LLKIIKILKLKKNKRLSKSTSFDSSNSTPTTISAMLKIKEMSLIKEDSSTDNNKKNIDKNNTVLVTFIIILSIVCVIQFFLTLGSMYVIYKSRYSKSAQVFCNPFRSTKIDTGKHQTIGNNNIVANNCGNMLEVCKKDDFMGTEFMSRHAIGRLTPDFLRDSY